MEYAVLPLQHPPARPCDWDGPVWSTIPCLQLQSFHPKSSSHRPHVAAKLAYTTQALWVLFRVRDRYVRSVCLNYQDTVCQDSCVELFLQPKPDRGYFNFEVNCGGTMLLYHIEDPVIEAGEFRKYQKIPSNHAGEVRIATTMPKSTPTEITDSVEWRLEMVIPRTLMERYVGSIEWSPNQQWAANLYKCGDATSHPHWGSWSPIGSILNFHQPDKFGTLRLQ